MRGRDWVSFSPIHVTIPFGSRSVVHEFNLWKAYPKLDEEGDFDLIRFTRRSWMECRAQMHGQPFRVALIDGNNDGRFSGDDRWSIVVEDASADRAVGSIRLAALLNQPCFVGEQAYRISRVAASGLSATVAPSGDLKPKPKVSTEPRRPRATLPLLWLDDLAKAREQSTRQGKPLLIKWTADWCGPCKVMDQTAFRDREVVELLQRDYVCLKLDRDKEYRLADKQLVKSLPTVQIWDASGKELERKAGLLKPAEMRAWLNEVTDLLR